MITRRLLLASLFVLSTLPGLAHGSISFSLGGDEVSGSGAGAVPDNAITLSFVDQALDTVRLTITAGLGAVKVTDIVFNVDSSITSLGFSPVSGVPASPDFDANAKKLSGQLDDFDVIFEFAPNGSQGTFYNGLSSVYDLTAPGLTASLFNVTNNDGAGPHYGGAHINKPNGTSPSGKYGTPTDDVIPEPASMLVWGLLLGCLHIKRSRA